MSLASELPWDAELAQLLPGDLRDEAAAFIARLPAGYREQTSPAQAALDLAEITALFPGRAGEAPIASAEAKDAGTEEPPAGAAAAVQGNPPMGRRHVLVVRRSTDPASTFRLRRFGEHGIELTSTLPLLESFGLVIIESIPIRLAPGPDRQPAVHIDDMGVRIEAPFGPEALRFVPEIHGPRLVEAIEASARGDADVDSLNRLVTEAGLDWRQVGVLRGYLRYWMQAGTGLSWEDLVDPLAQHPDVARALIAYFQARFDPDPEGEAAGPGLTADERGDRERTLCRAQLELVTQLGDDHVLHAMLSLIDATLRTNYFRPGAGSAARPLVLKFDSAAVPELPAPRPVVEAFVHGPTVEGVHLRAGLIARGGLRWSERPTDFRTEVLDLAFAQVKKNAIIVPTGAKGGFVSRTPATGPPTGLGKVRPSQGQVKDAYVKFVSGLLEITDNLVAGQVVTPDRVVAYDGPDPYLVVAADKGTATFSDVANSISHQNGFWLGDAFASGGSHGYDHKAMGITARGAWVAVRRHFRELGLDVSSDPIRVVGVGDMSGDVFGNGMLQSRAIRLLAAFDHRHLFLDPDPDPGRSFEERRRLAALDHSSWADYRPDVISAGGGVWSRDTKVVPVAPPVQAALGIGVPELSPPQLISAILAAPVDLLWFGGIGTFIKAPDESDVDVADHANDGVRITSDKVRARVIAEGANLGVTQKARIRYSRRGGRINADFIDNAAGVATSDREVNLKILLALAAERGRLDPADRDQYLSRSQAEVAADVLRQVDHSVAALNRAVASSDRDLDAYEALIDSLEAAGHFDRTVEVLPGREEFQVRRSAGAGLIRPELATILAYAKSDLVGAIESSGHPEDRTFLDAVIPYFPGPIGADFADLVPDHRLYPQLVATDVAGEIVDQMGIVWAHDLVAELGSDLSDLAGPFWAARQVTGAGLLWSELETMAADPAAGLSAETEAALHGCVSDAVGELVRWYLSEPEPFDAGAVVSRDVEVAGAAAAINWLELKAEQAALIHAGASHEQADRFLAARRRVSVVQAGSLSQASGRSVAEVLETTRLLDEAAGLGVLAEAIRETLDASPPPDRLRVWQARALLDDLEAWRSRAARVTLASGGSPEDAVMRWSARHRSTLEQARSIAPVPGGPADPLAVAALSLRRLQKAAGPV